MPTRRRVLHLGTVGLVGALAGCTSGLLGERESGEDQATETTPGGSTTSETNTDRTTRPMTVTTSLPEGSVEFREGPKSPPERPDDLAAERVREYVRAYERRYVYNSLYGDETTEIQQECGVESVTEYGVGFRVVVRCRASSNTGGAGETTLHADYFTRYATYFVGPNSTVRHEGQSEKRE